MDRGECRITFSQKMMVLDAVKELLYGNTVILTAPDNHIKQRAVRLVLDLVRTLQVVYEFSNGILDAEDGRQMVFIVTGERLPQVKHKPNPFNIKRIIL